MKKTDGTFEEDIDCIIEPINGKGAIFISNIQAAQNRLTLQKHKIGAVISAVKGKNLANTMPKHIEYLYIPAIDHQSFDISQYFDGSYQLLNQQLQRTNVLVHCMAGVSRSATLVIAYLMRSKQISLQEAFNLVRNKRKIIHPNSSFIQQLRDFQIKIKFPLKKQVSQSTSSSWYSSNKKKLSSQVNEEQYDKKLMNKIHDIFLKVEQKKRKLGTS